MLRAGYPLSHHGGDFLHRKQEMAGIIYSKHINNYQFVLEMAGIVYSKHINNYQFVFLVCSGYSVGIVFL